MPRRTVGIIEHVWAESGDTETPESVGLTQATGWPLSYEQTDAPQREVFNWWWRQQSAHAKDVDEHGILEWHASVQYVHPAYVTGRDTRLYKSKQDSLNKDPVTDTARLYWQPVVDSTDGTITPSGALTADSVPGLPASKIVSGLLAAARIPGLAASKITSGVFNIARIPNLPASKVTSGEFNSARLPVATDSARGALKIRLLTEAQYDALSSKDAETQYLFTS